MRNKKKVTGIIAALFLAGNALLAPFGSVCAFAGEEDAVEAVEGAAENREAPEIEGLTYERTLDLKYAVAFDVHYYEGGYKLLVCYNSATYLLVPEGAEIPASLPEDIIILQQPLHNVYLAASSVMALFDAIGGTDVIRLSGLNTNGWYIDNAIKAMEEGKLLFAGKYSEPDYELLINEDCNLAIESTMILHTPKVQEMIENMGIPVFIDRSSYESHPLGRTEWVKMYGAMLDKEEEAAAFFDQQASILDELKDFPNTEKTVAFFFINTDGSVVVRRTTDYVPKMIEIAGGRYVLDGVEAVSGEESKRSSISITMEEFYANALDSDYLIYNGTIDTPLNSLDDLFAKSDLFHDFKAVQEGNVWCAGKYLYQATDIVAQLIRDINVMLTTGDESQMTFLTKIN